MAGWRESQTHDAATAGGAATAAHNQQHHNPALQATRVTITRPWRLHSPDTAFIPQPAPKAAHTHGVKPVAQTQQQPHDTSSTNPPLATAAAASEAPPAARVTGPQVSVCKFFVNTGRCAKGSSCPFLHTAAGGAASRSRWLQQRSASVDLAGTLWSVRCLPQGSWLLCYVKVSPCCVLLVGKLTLRCRPTCVRVCCCLQGGRPASEGS